MGKIRISAECKSCGAKAEISVEAFMMQLIAHSLQKDAAELKNSICNCKRR